MSKVADASADFKGVIIEGGSSEALSLLTSPQGNCTVVYDRNLRKFQNYPPAVACAEFLSCLRIIGMNHEASRTEGAIESFDWRPIERNMCRFEDLVSAEEVDQILHRDEIRGRLMRVFSDLAYEQIMYHLNISLLSQGSEKVLEQIGVESLEILGEEGIRKKQGEKAAEEGIDCTTAICPLP